MKTKGVAQRIEVTIRIIDTIEIDAREAAFLRQMAQFCVEHRMAGCLAARKLDEVLAAAGITDSIDGPVYGIFE